MRSRSLPIVLGLLAVLPGCSWSGDTQSAEPEVFSGHQFAIVQEAGKALGEDCSVGGESDCQGEGAVCFHYSDDPKAGYACSVPCEAETDCPESWECVALAPSGTDNRYCAPPPSWSAARTKPRAGRELRKAARD